MFFLFITILLISILSFSVYYYNQSNIRPTSKSNSKTLANKSSNEAPDNEVVIVPPLMVEDDLSLIDNFTPTIVKQELPLIDKKINPSSINEEKCCRCSNCVSSEDYSDDYTDSDSSSTNDCMPAKCYRKENTWIPPPPSSNQSAPLIVNNEGFGEVNFRSTANNTLKTNSSNVSYTIKNQIKLNCFSSTITFNYNDNNQHDAIYILNNIDSMWSNVTAGLAMLEINGQQKILSYNTKYNKDAKVLTLYINDTDEQVYKLSGINIKITILLADCVNPLTNLINPGYHPHFPPGGHYMSR